MYLNIHVLPFDAKILVNLTQLAVTRKRPIHVECREEKRSNTPPHLGLCWHIMSKLTRKVWNCSSFYFFTNHSSCSLLTWLNGHLLDCMCIYTVYVHKSPQSRPSKKLDYSFIKSKISNDSHPVVSSNQLLLLWWLSVMSNKTRRPSPHPISQKNLLQTLHFTHAVKNLTFDRSY